jgi:hypothetical protein
MDEILKMFGFFAIGTSIIVSTIAFLGKKILDQFLKRDLEKFKNQLIVENEKAKLEFEKQVENYKATLNLFNSKQIKLYSKQASIIETLYKYLTDVHWKMLDMTALFRNVTGKDDQTISAEELDRVQVTAEAGNLFFEFYRNNKIYFSQETCELIESIQNQLRETHSDYSFKYVYGLPPSEMTYEMAKNANEKVREDIPKLLTKLENDFRECLGVIDKFNK